MLDLPYDEAAIRLLLSLGLGAIIGLEREYHRQPAGLRTHILVCLGSTVFTLISISSLTMGVSPEAMVPGVQYTINRDPARIAAQVVSGIGFIGGGAVLRHGANIRGLTTAASLWMIASIGMLAGVGSYRLSLMATLVAFLVLFTIGNLERTYFRKHQKKFNRLRLQVTVAQAEQAKVQDWIEQSVAQEVLQLSQELDETRGQVALTYVLDVKGIKLNVKEWSKTLAAFPGITNSSFRLFMGIGDGEDI